MISLDEINHVPPAEFVSRLGGIFEHSPWVAERVTSARPFASRQQLLDAMRAAVDQAQPDEQLALIRAHPQLGLRGRARRDLTALSSSEQHGAGLDECDPADVARLAELNAAYLAKFAMPFIVAVRGHSPKSIIANCELRLTNDWAAEKATALRQIGLIAGFRLFDLIAEPAG